MPEVMPQQFPDQMLILKQKEKTRDGDYEFLAYHHFQPVSYDRLMSWKAGTGSIVWGRGSTVREKTTESKEQKVLPKGNGVVVMDMDFRLVKE